MYQEEALHSLDKGLVKEIEFSGGTYQVLVEDPLSSKKCWVFLQLEGKGQIKDAFCDCEETNDWTETTPCLHIATAYLSLYGPHAYPLHQRFARSLWNQLCQIYAERVGDNPNRLIHVEPGLYEFKSNQHKTLFKLHAKSAAATDQLQAIIDRHPKETEETSLKFSNLSQEELNLWRAGHPSQQLRYQLSYWSDLAKWMMQLQEAGANYAISFTYSNREIPNSILIQFDELDAQFYLPESRLPLIIPALATVKSPLIVQHAEHEHIAGITYKRQDGSLHIESEKLPAPNKAKQLSSSKAPAVALNGWIYVPKEGFFTDEPHILLQTPILQQEELSHALSEYGRLIAKFLSDYEVHFSPVPANYQLWFDAEWNLHIICYVFEPGDLQKNDSRLIGEWAFLDDDGFYHLKDKRFEETETIVPFDQISDFVTQNRAWLNGQEGFETHVRSIEYQLSYKLSANNRLTFVRTVAKAKKDNQSQDFGSWVYLDKRGFYPKAMGSYGLQIKPGLSLSAEQVPLFIKTNHDELALIPGFFSTVCPITKTGLKIELIDDSKIQIAPEYEIMPSYRQKPIQFFDEFVYVDEEGFYELPLNMRLPDKFRHFLELEGEERDLFLQDELESIRKFIWHLDPRLVPVAKSTLCTHFVTADPEKGRGWYRFSFFFDTERGPISALDIWNAMKKKQRFAFFKAGLVDLRDKRFDWIRHLKKERIDKPQASILLTALEFMRLNAFEPIDLSEQAATDSRNLLDELIQLRTPTEPNIGGLLSHLRPYQEIGVQWLWFLYQQQLSGLLCDDMGLGKTHQAMALLSSINNLYQSYAQGVQKHFLIVCPTSVIYHWQEKLEQFLPGLKVYTFYGIGRNLGEFKEQYDILLTSYGILRNESPTLSKIPFELAIFDEIQIAKNQSSRIYTALTKVKAQMKLGLTGTPIENYLRELKSLFDIVLPSYMPGEGEYRELFIKPIEKEHNQHRKDILNRLIKPFILRRRKKDVLTDLPEKIEEISHCDLLSHQRQLYSEVLQQRRRHILEELESDGAPVPYLHIFALLSSLKQICDHPAVYFKKAVDYKQYTSGKWELFLELLREARESNQKVVVFSQYLGMLDIIESYLTEHHIGFASLRGATQNRKEQIHRFNQEPSCEVFVGSLQAAGLGVDLTAGSVVIHYDRWWNAARENQATDRVHRIGQTRGVQVFKLVTKNTVEEKIDLMIQRKAQLMEDVIGVDDHNSLKRFSREDLLDLLSFDELEEEHVSISDVD
jgi:SNF2 family DNA or RNA helicase